MSAYLLSGSVMERLTGEFSLCSFQLFDLIHQPVDPILDLLGLSLVLAWTGLPAYIGVFERADAVVELGPDHVGQVLVVKFLHVAALATLDCVVVQVDLHLSHAAVEGVEVCCFA